MRAIETDTHNHDRANHHREMERSTRRTFLAGLGSVAGVGILGTGPAAADTSPSVGSVRLAESSRRRQLSTANHATRPAPLLLTNNDEQRWPNGLANFTKTLQHNQLGEVEPEAYNALVAALLAGDGGDFDALPGGGPRRLANPRAAHCFTISGVDPHQIDMPAIHSLGSARQSAEAAEVYWMAAARDVRFDHFSYHPLIGQAVRDLNRYSDFTGPRTQGQVTEATVFRGLTPGDNIGPYISQFLLADVPYGNRTLRQTAPTPAPFVDFMAHYDEWLSVQNGASPSGAITMHEPETYIRTPRDLSNFVHSDYTYEATVHAGLICLSLGPEALDDNPYSRTRREGAFLTFGAADTLDLVARAAVVSLRPAWFHKWLVHRKLRPETYGGRLHNHLTGAASYDLGTEILDSPVLDLIGRNTGTFLLHQAYPEGSPTHPSYPAGHATIAGAGVTVLKAIFNEQFVLPRPVVPSADGSWLRQYVGSDLTIGGELNKLASNIAMGRNMAGVHWRADGDDGLAVGEEVALALLQDHLREVVEDGGAYRLTRFDGQPITVTADAITHR